MTAPQVVAAERAGGDDRRRDVDDGFQPAVREVVADRARAVQGHPQAALGVDGEAVGQARAVFDRDEGATPGQRVTIRADVEHVDPAGRKGTRPIVKLIETTYDKGVRIAKDAFRTIESRLQRHDSLPKYDVLIRPQPVG